MECLRRMLTGEVARGQNILFARAPRTKAQSPVCGPPLCWGLVASKQLHVRTCQRTEHYVPPRKKYAANTIRLTTTISS